MITKITYQHFCNLGALCNNGCFSQFNSHSNEMEYYYRGILSEACWMGWNKKGPY